MKNLNQFLALKINGVVSTMYCFYAFVILAIIGHPAFAPFNLHDWVQWFSTTFLQLVMLPLLAVVTTLSAVSVKQHVDNKQSKIEILHNALRADINKIHSHLGINKEPPMDQVKQHVENALAAIEAVLDEFGPSLQIIKDKLVDIRDFLDRVDTTAQVPATPDVAVVTDAETPAEQASEPAEEVAPVATPAVDTTVAVEPAVAPVVDQAVETEASPADVIEDGPVTDSAGNPVSDPNAPR